MHRTHWIARPSRKSIRTTGNTPKRRSSHTANWGLPHNRPPRQPPPPWTPHPRTPQKFEGPGGRGPLPHREVMHRPRRGPLRGDGDSPRPKFGLKACAADSQIAGDRRGVRGGLACREVEPGTLTAIPRPSVCQARPGARSPRPGASTRNAAGNCIGLSAQGSGAAQSPSIPAEQDLRRPRRALRHSPSQPRRRKRPAGTDRRPAPQNSEPHTEDSSSRNGLRAA